MSETPDPIHRYTRAQAIATPAPRPSLGADGGHGGLGSHPRLNPLIVATAHARRSFRG
jgi:hypothetical protein